MAKARCATWSSLRPVSAAVKAPRSVSRAARASPAARNKAATATRDAAEPPSSSKARRDRLKARRASPPSSLAAARRTCAAEIGSARASYKVATASRAAAAAAQAWGALKASTSARATWICGVSRSPASPRILRASETRPHSNSKAAHECRAWADVASTRSARPKNFRARGTSPPAAADTPAAWRRCTDLGHADNARSKQRRSSARRSSDRRAEARQSHECASRASAATAASSISTAFAVSPRRSFKRAAS
mmetsp:Transcript_13892/g.46364  ORF Transcript_13892/g.46364 Transcript_13892/m.46364 type:complete len:251 (-) Transcript_13892:146-898(-)